MTLDEVIKHAEKDMVENLEKTKGRNASDPIAINCFKRAEEYREIAGWLKGCKKLVEMHKTKRYELGDRIFCKHYKELLTTALILSSEGYGVKVIGLRGVLGNILTITALPEEKRSDSEYKRLQNR